MHTCCSTDHAAKYFVHCFIGGPFLIGAGNYCLRCTCTTTSQPPSKHGNTKRQLENTDEDKEQPEEQQHSEQTDNRSIENARLEAGDKRTVYEVGTTDVEFQFFIEVPRRRETSLKCLDRDPDDDCDPMEDPDFGFYIYCKVDDTKLYLCADSTDESKVCLVTSVPYPNAYARFYVEFPSTRRLAPVSRWEKDSLHVLRKTAYMKRRQYLVIDAQTRQLSFTSGEELDRSQRVRCQFAVINMPIASGSVKRTEK